MKLKRNDCAKTCKEEIDKIYREINEKAKQKS